MSKNNPSKFWHLGLQNFARMVRLFYKQLIREMVVIFMMDFNPKHNLLWKRLKYHGELSQVKW